MKRWQDFLDSLSTAGGNIFICSIGLTAACIYYLHILHHAPDAASIENAKALVIGFSAALFAMLKGNSSRQQMSDRTEAAVASPKTTVASAQTVNVDQNPKQ